MKVVLIVLDSFGIGQMPDAKMFGDEGSHTYLNTLKETGVELNNMISLGLNNIDGVELSKKDTIGRYARLKELTIAKDTTAGHYEICGVVLENPYPTFPQGFPKNLMDKLENKINVKFIGNEVASGTEIIARLGDKHISEKKPIIYTSADSVLQIATHTDVFSLEELYSMCEKAREVCSGKYSVGRVIARPFATNAKGEYYRLENRRDYALECPELNLLDKLKNAGKDVVSIGKIEDIFCYRGITESYHSKNNHEGIEEILKASKRRDINGLVFANLNDTDSLYGHRNNPKGYADALKEFDSVIPEIIDSLDKDDILMITADHGCDPTTVSTDHSREYVPLLVYGKSLEGNKNLGTLIGFNNISNTILNVFGVENNPENILI